MSASTPARAILALARANLRYWTTVAPLSAHELRRWELRAHAIVDPAARQLALGKLREERFNAQVAATLTTLAPRAVRARSVIAVVALEVAYDYLDGLTELPIDDPLQSARSLFATFTGAFDPDASSLPQPESRIASPPRGHDEGYLRALAAAARHELTGLPAWPLVASVTHDASLRAAEAQARLHAAPALGDSQLEQWAGPLAQQAGLGWREFLAGAAASVLVCHALLVAAADPASTVEDAERLDAFYLRLSALSTLLDAVVDRDSDSGCRSVLRLYHDGKDLADALCSLAREAETLAEHLPDGPHHLMIMLGVVAYYTSARPARSAFAAPISRRLRRDLAPWIVPTLAVLYSWRAAKRLRTLAAGGSGLP